MTKRREDPRDIDPGLPKALRRIYREVPAVVCKGLCWETCQSVPAQQIEVEHAARVGAGRENPAREPYFCPYLSADHRCGCHSARPLVCRLFGVVPLMRCPHGCVPEGGMISEAKSHALVKRILELDPRLSGMNPELRTAMESNPWQQGDPNEHRP